MLEEKIRENRLRRMAKRQGLRLDKSRRRDPHAIGYGTYELTDPYTNTVKFYDSSISGGFGLTLDEIEDILKDGAKGFMAKD